MVSKDGDKGGKEQGEKHLLFFESLVSVGEGVVAVAG